MAEKSTVAAAAAGGGAAAGGAAPLAAEAVVQRQLEAYNSRDLEAFMALMDEDCIATDAVTGWWVCQPASRVLLGLRAQSSLQVLCPYTPIPCECCTQAR